MFALSSQTTPSLPLADREKWGGDTQWANEGWAPAPPWTPARPLGRGPGPLPFHLWFPHRPASSERSFQQPPNCSVDRGSGSTALYPTDQSQSPQLPVAAGGDPRNPQL